MYDIVMGELLEYVGFPLEDLLHELLRVGLALMRKLNRIVLPIFGCQHDSAYISTWYLPKDPSPSSWMISYLSK